MSKADVIFFTLVTYNRHPVFEKAENIDRFRAGFAHVMKKYPFHIQAIVILPDHLHSVLKLPAHDNDFALRWRLIKHFVARGINVPINNRG